MIIFAINITNKVFGSILILIFGTMLLSPILASAGFRQQDWLVGLCLLILLAAIIYFWVAIP